MKPRTRVHKPLLGFGPAGWILLTIFMALLIPTLFDIHAVRDRLHAIIAFFFGPDILYPFVMRGWHHSLALFYPVVNLLTGIVAPIALYISPYRIRWYWYTSWAIACLLLPLIPFEISIIVNRRYGYPAGWSTIIWCITEAVNVLLFAILVRMITRSRIVAGAWVFALIVTLDFRLSGVFGYFSPLQIWLAVIEYHFVDLGDILFHALTLGSLFFWAFRERRRAMLPDSACPTCDYDLSGLSPSAPCPECGMTPDSENPASGAVVHDEVVNHDPKPDTPSPSPEG